MGHCPTPKKVDFFTQHAAQASMDRIHRGIAERGGQRPGEVLPTRVYMCPCGMYHLASKPERSFEQREADRAGS